MLDRMRTGQRQHYMRSNPLSESDYYHETINGITYEMALQNPDGSFDEDKPDVIIKTVDASQLEYEQYRNSFEELITEHKAALNTMERSACSILCLSSRARTAGQQRVW